jgi:hypothetical protein
MHSRDDQPLTFCQVLAEEFSSLRETPLVQPWGKEEDLELLYAHAHKQRFSAVCLSGGGIRSATFCLGVLQGLARLRLLDRLDYLSTVSGGGFIGSWLMAWIHNHPGGAPAVFEELRQENPRPEKPEADEIRHLRSYSNYLTPKLGFLSADAWTIVAIYLRNLLMIWLVLLPFFAAALMVPRLLVAVMGWGEEPAAHKALAAAVLLGVMGTAYVALHRPSRTGFLRAPFEALRKRTDGQGWFLFLCLAPLVTSALSLVLYGAWTREVGGPQSGRLAYGILGLAVFGSGWAFVALAGRRLVEWRWLHLVVGEIVIVAAAGFSVGWVMWLFVAKALPALSHRLPDLLLDSRFYASFGVPVFLAGALLTTTIFVGLFRRWSADEDREWWARAGAWVLLTILAWSAISVLVIYAPDCFGRAPCLGDVPAELLAGVGGLSGIITALIGWSGKTPAKPGEATKGGIAAAARKAGLGIAATIFILFVIVTISWLTSTLIRIFDMNLVGSHLDDHRDVILKYGWPEILVPMAILIAIVALMDSAIDINKFSLHSMYRNRLIRAYLGASNKNRKPNRFTGLDSTDNIDMHHMRRILLEHEDLQDWRALCRTLLSSEDPIPAFIRSHLKPESEATLAQSLEGNEASEGEVIRALLFELNERLQDSDLTLEVPAKLEASGKTGDRGRITKNRDALVKAFEPEIVIRLPRKPMHVINVTLNLVGGEDLAWQERKGESFTITAHHSGSRQLEAGRGGYRPSSEYGKKPKGPITLGTAAAISGAAASPNMGYHSSTTIGLVMTFFNARLGWWLGNPGSAGKGTFENAGPKFNLRPLVAEAFGRTNDRSAYVYLSDGGHFENLGLYEMVLRRCHYIVVVDASADPGHVLENLGNAIRKIRIDMGISISLDTYYIYRRPTGSSSRSRGLYCATGKILYADVDDGDPEPGRLLYIKPSVYLEEEPQDIRNYALSKTAFPHEATTDQWFSESQFESYRMLGYHIMKQVCNQKKFEDKRKEARQWNDSKAWEALLGCVEDYVSSFKP